MSLLLLTERILAIGFFNLFDLVLSIIGIGLGDKEFNPFYDLMGHQTFFTGKLLVSVVAFIVYFLFININNNEERYGYSVLIIFSDLVVILLACLVLLNVFSIGWLL